jgi:hypothetical protein
MRHLKVSLNRRQHLLTLSLCLLIGQFMMSTDATGQIDWLGVFSPEICFTATFDKAVGPLKDDAQLRVSEIQAFLAVVCDNTSDTGVKCQLGGTGNEGAAVVNDLCTKGNPADCIAGPDPLNNNKFEGCIDLSRWFVHPHLVLGLPDPTYHTCNPPTNTNLAEITRSGRVVALNGKYTLIRSSSAPHQQIAATGSYSCTWPGIVAPVGCLVTDNNDCCQADLHVQFACTCFDGEGNQLPSCHPEQ